MFLVHPDSHRAEQAVTAMASTAQEISKVCRAVLIAALLQRKLASQKLTHLFISKYIINRKR
jgi:hypothetical protein